MLEGLRYLNLSNSILPWKVTLFFLRPLQYGGYLPLEPENYSRSRYIIIEHVLWPKIQDSD